MVSCRGVLLSFAIIAALIMPPNQTRAGATHDVVAEMIREYRNNEPRKIGVMAGARHFCGLEIKQFTHNYSTRIGFTMQRPEILWDRMIEQAKATVSRLRREGDRCDETTKAYVQRLGY